MNAPLSFDLHGGRIGTWLKISSLVTLEVVSQSEFDFVIVDLEHSPISLEWIHTVCAVAQPCGTAVLVRLPDPSGAGIQRVLDVGVDGVVVPQIRTAEQAQAVLASAMFPPAGHRGVGITSRAGRWGARPRAEYITHGNQNVLHCIQIETDESFDNLDQILDLAGLNSVLLGVADLAASLGVPAGDPVLGDLSERLVESAAARSIPCGTSVANPQEAREALVAGFNFVVVGNDATTFATAMSSMAAQTAQLTRKATQSQHVHTHLSAK
jgi:2-keto-3-deoxy-L-rhamnonate aldolase RhmA